MFADDEDIGGRLYGLYEGFVFDNQDEEKRGRIRVVLPGLIDEPATAWADPKGATGRNRGAYRVPEIGAPVFVQFVNGEPDRPVWEAGPFHHDEAGSCVPTDAAAIDEGELDKVQTYETDRWVITLDDREDQPLLVVRDKVSGDLLEFDGKKNGVTISGSFAVRVTSKVVIDLDAPLVQIKGRQVLPTKKPI